ncbi:unnamed protein product [Kuraishia capsulata CBS 1993]|uniref:Ribose-5-phosphate isomerase n=1 Tax=Kuraishia capsulata CBS 1993 TaxID=1382522 RepID=W6MV76_9ASCO|nr:uncharacterized protein KUCA_T00002086001 [Kuraishia capsulata CBS 1993]CDK26115.1 unnamed protein product [Kuraishia capsulata CBS 1993]
MLRLLSKPQFKRTIATMVDLVEQSKKLAAYKAVDENLKPSDKYIGIGSGSTVVYVAERIGQLKRPELVCVPTGFQSKDLIISNGLTLGSIDQYCDLDVAFDGADEIDSQLNLIKGGGACLFQEKLVASCSKKFVVVADYRKKSPEKLGYGWKKGVPIEVVPSAYPKLLREFVSLKGKPTLRSGLPGKAGPIVTDNGNFILDVDFGEIPVEKVESLNSTIKALCGVVETGFFVNMTSKVYIGEENGEVLKIDSCSKL